MDIRPERVRQDAAVRHTLRTVAPHRVAKDRHVNGGDGDAVHTVAFAGVALDNDVGGLHVVEAVQAYARRDVVILDIVADADARTHVERTKVMPHARPADFLRERLVEVVQHNAVTAVAQAAVVEQIAVANVRARYARAVVVLARTPCDANVRRSVLPRADVDAVAPPRHGLCATDGQVEDADLERRGADADTVTARRRVLFVQVKLAAPVNQDVSVEHDETARSCARVARDRAAELDVNCGVDNQWH